MLDWLNETYMATRLESPIARVIAEGKVRTYEKHVRSPPRHGLAVARAATLPHSPSPRPSPITPVHKSSEARSRLFLGRWTRIFQSVTKTKHRAQDVTSSD